MDNALRAYSQDKMMSVVGQFQDPKGPSGNIPNLPSWSDAIIRQWVIYFDSVHPCLIITAYRSILYGNYTNGLLSPPTEVIINRQVVSFNSEATYVRQITTPPNCEEILGLNHPDLFPDIVNGDNTDLWTPPPPTLACGFTCSLLLTDLLSYNPTDLAPYGGE